MSCELMWPKILKAPVWEKKHQESGRGVLGTQHGGVWQHDWNGLRCSIHEKALTIGDDGCVLCPECKTQIKTGNSGIQNFIQWHQGSAQCAAKKKKKAEENIEKNKQNALRWFWPQVPVVLPTVTAPLPVHPPPHHLCNDSHRCQPYLWELFHMRTNIPLKC